MEQSVEMSLNRKPAFIMPCRTLAQKRQNTIAKPIQIRLSSPKEHILHAPKLPAIASVTPSATSLATAAAVAVALLFIAA